jgi:hypothetical protein
LRNIRRFGVLIAVDVLPTEVPILDMEPDVGIEIAGALHLAVSDTNKPSASLIFELPAALLYLTYNIIISITMQPRKSYLRTLFSHSMFRP